MKTIQEMRDWIVKHYGEITEDHAGGVYLAIVPVFEGVCVGLGARKNNAIFDLMLSLSLKQIQPFRGMAFLPWEKRRHRARSKVNKLNRACRGCGCTDDDCRTCIERTGEPCQWVEWDLCSACVPKPAGVKGGAA